MSQWKELARQAQERAVLLAATEILQTKGFAFTTMEEVAEKAGISKATLYKLFPSKEELLERVVEFHHHQVQEELEKIPPENFRQSFPKLLDLFFSQLEKRYNFVKLMMIEAISNGPFLKSNRKRLHERIIQNRNFYRKIIGEFVAAGKREGYIREPQEAITGLILAVLKGVALELIFYEEEEFKRFTEFTRKKIMELVGLKEG